MTLDLSIIRPISVEVRRVTATDDAQAVADKLMALEAILQWAKDAREQIEQSAMEWIRDNGPIDVGEIRYFIEREKKPAKCIDVKATVEALMNAAEGDFNRFCEHLAAGAIKPGAAKRTLAPADYVRLFRVEEKDRLRSEPTQPKLGKAPIAILEAKR